MVAIIVGFLGMFQYLGLSTATVKWSELNHEQVSTLFWVNIGLSAAIMILTICAAPLAAWFFKEPRLTGITIGYAVAILITGAAIQHEAILIRQMRFSIIAVIEISAMAIGLSAAIVAALYGARYWALVINQLVLATVTVIGSWSACRWRPSLPVRGTNVRSMLSYGGNLTNTAHGFIGGTIGNPHTSFRDPFVFLLHSNVDRLFAMWQRQPSHPERQTPILFTA